MTEEVAPRYSPKHVRPLGDAENQFLQVLITQFDLTRRASGLELAVEFSRHTPAIWSDRAKAHLLAKLSPAKRARLQLEIDAFVDGGSDHYRHPDESFPFRFGNGGTLPIVRVGDEDYFCLFYRDAHPAGWNIANGGANNVHDLLHPASIIERELREELIVFEPTKKHRYVFEWHDARLHDHPDFARADELWRERFRRTHEGIEFRNIPLPLKWIPQTEEERSEDSDRQFDSVVVAFGDERIHTHQGFLNINAVDFGIEFDRIAKLSVGAEAVFCDGELHGRGLLDRPVGLFRVAKMLQELKDGDTQFVPDRIYWNGREWKGGSPESVIRKSLDARGRSPVRGHGRGSTALAPPPMDLCPVTRNILRRFQKIVGPPAIHPPTPPSEAFEIFLSFGSPDRPLATEIHRKLQQSVRKQVFFSDAAVDFGPFSDQIDRALTSAKALVAVASDIRHLRRRYVQYEWESFHNDILAERKAEGTPFIAFVNGILKNDLPRPFLYHDCVIDIEELGHEGAIARLCDVLRSNRLHRGT